MICCTVYDRSRLGPVRALIGSLREHHPDIRLLALCIGESVDLELSDVEIIGLPDLPIDRPWSRVALTPMERRDQVLMGPLVAAALTRGDRVLYLSTSMRVCAPLDPLLDALDEHNLALVGMAERRLPDDGGLPSSDAVEAAGLVNPRVLAVRRSSLADELLAQWPASADPELEHDRRTELTADAVVRQLERFAAASSAALLHDPGLGLGYWNLALRDVTERDGILLAGGKRLRLVDLVGIDEDPAGLWPQQDRVDFLSRPELGLQLVRYADELRATPPDAPPPYLTDGRDRSFDAVHRSLLREAIDADAVQHPPWTQDGAAEWEAFLDQPANVGAASGITRYHHAIWRSRDDLQRAFPDLDGEDGPKFARWVVEWGPEAEDLPEPGDAVPLRALPWGVNVAGFFRSELGLGEAARLLITGLDSANVPALPVHGHFVPPTRQDTEFTFTTPSESPYPINIICLNGDIVPGFAREAQQRFFVDRHTIALWWWEVVGAFPPEWHDAFEHIDEIWVASDHIYKAVAPHSPVPVNKVRMPVVMPRIGHYSRAQLVMPEDGFVFLYVFDYHSTAARKNPVGHIEAFNAAFGEGSGAKLVLKSINADRMATQHLRTMLAIDGHPDITVIDRFVSADEKNAMLAACDCYVSLHRSEGFGLTPAEAMALAKPVIATRYGGTLDFMTDENSYLVEHGWTRVGAGAHPYPADATWAEPDLDHAARLMREVFEDRAEANRRGRRAQKDIRERHAPAVAGEVMRARLQNIHNGLARRGSTELTVAPTGWDRDVTQQRIAMPLAPPGGRGAPAKHLARGVVQRLLHPFLVRQHSIDQHLYDGLLAMENRLVEIPVEAAERAEIALREERAQTLAALRRVRSQLEDHTRWLTSVDHRVARATDHGDDIHTGLSSVERRIDRHLGEHQALPFMTEPFERWDEPHAGTVEGFLTPAATQGGEDYHDFEQRFRGTRERIIDLQRPYVDLLRAHAPVLDCGCGRGELLQLLRDEGIAASGIDLDAGMLGEARRLGLDVTAGDAVQRLSETPPGTLGAVTAMQVIEHMPETVLVAFLQASRRALRGGGRLIVETVNPHSVVALKAFWLDPTHQHPLFPEVVLELCREAGFERGFVMHPGGEGDVTRDRYAIPAYAVVADVAAS